MTKTDNFFTLWSLGMVKNQRSTGDRSDRPWSQDTKGGPRLRGSKRLPVESVNITVVNVYIEPSN